MGIWYSTPKNVVSPDTNMGTAPRETEKIPMRHRPTCINSDIEAGLAELNEKQASDDTKTQ